MQTKIISADDRLRLCARPEDHFFDRKALAVDGKKVQKIAVALANADGGEFAIGILDDADQADPNLRWAPASKIESFNGHLQALSTIQPAVAFSCTFLESTANAGHVMLVEIPKSPHVHCVSDGTVYLRVGAQSLPVKDPERIAALGFAKGAASYEDTPLIDAVSEDVVDAAELKSFLLGYSPTSEPLEFAVNQNLLDRGTWKPRVAGVLLFHAAPSAIIPKKCAVKVVRYETKEEEPERDHLKATVTIEGPTYSLIHQTVQQVASIMASVSVWTASGLKPMAYPPEAIWEIVVNAIIHRDYSISDDVQILIFNNRIEVISPGRLPGYVTTANILEARYTRNAKLVRTLSRYPAPPNKDVGEGLNTAFQKMKEWKLKAPEISADATSVRVVIPHIPLASPSELILEFLATNPMIRNHQAREITGIKSENHVKEEFYKLRDAGLLEMVPGLKGAASAWRRT
jgi:ATP-dependent DNA helicase RecG